MNYATLLEAYNVDSFKKKKKERTTPEPEIMNNISIDEYQKEFNHCEPLQPPHYKLPISEGALENYNNAYQVFLKERKINEYNNKNNITPTQFPNNNNNNKHNINIYENYDKIKLENVKEIEPYYDEELDNYLNYNDFKSINYNYKNMCEDDIKNELMRKNHKLKTQDTLLNSDDYILVPKKKIKK